MSKELAFSLKAEDFDWEYKRGHGNGGQARNKTSSAVRVVHRPSGAVGEAQEQRSQLQNRRAALKKLIDTVAFKTWIMRQLSNDLSPEAHVEQSMQPQNMKVEVRKDGKWVDEETI